MDAGGKMNVATGNNDRKSRRRIPEFPVGIGRHSQLSGRRGEVLREQRRHLVGGLLGQPVRGAVEFGEARPAVTGFATVAAHPATPGPWRTRLT